MRLSFDVESVNPERLLRLYVPGEDDSLGMGRYESLDWGQFLSHLSSYCRCPKVAIFAGHLPFMFDERLIARRLAEVGEFFRMQEEGDLPVIESLEDVSESLMLAEKQSVLSAESLIMLGRHLVAFKVLRRFFEIRSKSYPLMWQYVEAIEGCGDLDKRISCVFGKDGEILDSASPDLAMLRRRSRSLSEGLRRSIEEKTKDGDILPILQDQYYTQREGRYVLPVKIQMRSKIDGIVHGTSGSGQTVFVEPTELVEMNNALRIAEFEIKAEEERILMGLTERVALYVGVIASNMRRYYYVDLVHAMACLGYALGASIPDISDGELSLYQARHPLLVLKAQHGGHAVVPNSLHIEGEARCLVISGANAGGKTVSLKILGLFALMLKVGMPLSAGASSCFPLFKGVFVDIGDEQSISQDKSTFSGHLISLVSALKQIRRGDLLLLDEPFSGTDPEHAGSLVISLMRYLWQRGVIFGLTTHLDSVKAYALEQSWAANAAVVFDFETMSPSYKLRMGEAGVSSAFEIAERLSLDPEILSYARQHYQGETRSSLEDVLKRLEESREAMERSRESLEAERGVLAGKIASVDALREKVLAKESVALSEAYDQSLTHLEKLRQRLKSIKRESYKREVYQKQELRDDLIREVEEIDKSLKQGVEEVKDLREPKRALLGREVLSRGMEVYCRKLRKNGVIKEILGDDVLLEVGQFEMRVPIGEIYKSEGVSAEKSNKVVDSSKGKVIHGGHRKLEVESDLERSEGEGELVIGQLRENSLDLRGMTADDALERLEFFLESLILRDVRVGTVIHGHGTGVLKREVREYFKSSSMVSKFRAGQYGEGGDGVSFVWVKI